MLGIAKGCTPLNSDDSVTKAQQYQIELNELIEERANVQDTMYLHGTSPFMGSYIALADLIVNATNMYVAIRNIEELLNGATDAT
jgi:hypothetical protein